jgi:glutamyl endopeptidase
MRLSIFVSLSTALLLNTTFINASATELLDVSEPEKIPIIDSSVEENFLISNDGISSRLLRIESTHEQRQIDSAEPLLEFNLGNDDFQALIKNLDLHDSKEESERGVFINDEPDVLRALEQNEDIAKRVIGPDLRQRLYTSKYPARATVLIKTETSSGVTKRCSGAMVSKNTVLTAGHCITNNRLWRNNVRVFPGQDDNASPYGMCTDKNLITNSRWFYHNDSNYDYALIKLSCNVGYSTGWYGVSTTYPNGYPSVVQGYPSKISLRGEQYLSADKVRSVSSRRIYYQNDTTGGMSGSPVWTEISRNGPYIIGVHFAGGSSYNLGTRINSEVFNIIRYSIDNFN